MARTGLRMMPTSPSSPLKFRTAGFPRYGFKADLSKGACPCGVHVSRRLVCVPPSYSPLADTESPCCAGGVARTSTVMRAASAALPQGPSLRAGLCCPGPSSLIRPHPSHSRAHPDFTAGRLIRDVFAVCVHLGDPRVVPGFRWQFCLGMSPSETPGRSSAAYTQSFADDTGLRPLRKVSAPPTPPHSASRGESNFGAYLRFAYRYDLSSCSPP
jgi:hypothetical protein